MDKEPTQKQLELIECMNEFCFEKFNGKTRAEASDYISRNIEEYKLETTSQWGLDYS